MKGERGGFFVKKENERETNEKKVSILYTEK